MKSYVPELDNVFLSLFPHRWDYIWAENPKPGEPPNWHTESKHPLSDRLILQGDRLYGVRFGAETSYFLLDIDKGSIYHPKRDPHAIRRMMEALEPLGITDCVAVTSSYSAGLHLYFPLSAPVASWKIAAVVSYCLKHKGFFIEDGILEILPNERNYDAEKVTLFKGHRLPLQAGSYLLSPKNWDLEWTTCEAFCARWSFCEWRNELSDQFEFLLQSALKTYRKLSFRGQKFLKDLDTDIEAGWTAHGQTNFLLGRITLRSYVFGHYLQGISQPLTGAELIKEIVKTAESLPGYKQWCRHQHEIWQRAEEWARCAENSRYYPFGKRSKPEPQPQPQNQKPPITWNSWQEARAREKICFALADQLNRGTLPAGARERFQLFSAHYQIGGETLYRHLDLWHPDYLWKTPPDPPTSLEPTGGNSSLGRIPPSTARSLFTEIGRNTKPDKDHNPFLDLVNDFTGGNTLWGDTSSLSPPGLSP